jgi:hypothetical protein
LPFGDPKELERVYGHVEDLLNHAFDNCPKGGDEDLPISEAALQATCVFDYLNRAVDDKGQKMPRELLAPNMLPGERNQSRSLISTPRGSTEQVDSHCQ